VHCVEEVVFCCLEVTSLPVIAAFGKPQKRPHLGRTAISGVYAIFFMESSGWPDA
jgi:hypothetical protein